MLQIEAKLSPCPRRPATRGGLRNFPLHFRDPVRTQLETRRRAHVRLDGRPQPRVGKRDIHRDAMGLRHVPGRVNVELDTVFFRVEEIRRQRVAVAHRAEIFHSRLGLDIAVERFQGRQVVHEKRKLVHDVEWQIGRPAGREHQLVVFLRVPGHEADLAAALQARAAVGHGEAHHAGVEIHHAIDIGNVDAGVSESER
jgi:hypothetical protein